MPTIPTHTNTPTIRFPDFLNDGDWEVKSFDELFSFLPNNTLSRAELNYEKGSTKNIHYGDVLIKFGECLDVGKEEIPFITDESVSNKYQNARLQNGDVVIADTAEDETVGKCTEIVGITDEVVVSGLHTMPIRPHIPFAQSFLGFYLNSESYRSQLKPLMQGVKVTSLSKSAVNKTTILCPKSIEEQDKIAQTLTALDELIAASNGKLEQLKAYKKGLLQKLFPAKGKTLPEFRFKEFENDGEWKEKNLGEVTQCINRRNKSNRALPIYSISNTDGFIPQSEQFAGLDSGSRGYDISLYKIVGKHTFAYNPARINVGSIGYSGDLKDVLISSLYVCFKTSDEMDDSFLMYFFSTSMFKQTVENNVEGGIRSYLFYENFSKIKIAYPTLNEQKKIALCLSSTDDLINTYTNKLLLLQTYKTGLMQQLFP